MKKILLATTAVAAVALASGDAYAQSSAAGPIKLGLGGYFQFYGVFGQQDDGVGEPGAFRHNFDFKREAEIFFTGQTKLDNGLIVGVDVQLEAESCTDQIDESYIWFQGNWGRLILGSENSAAYLLAVGAPAIDGNFDGQDPNYRLFNGVVGDPRCVSGQGCSSVDAWVPNVTGDSEKITYLSPRFAGFRVGASYTPDNSEEASSGQIAAKGGSFAGMPANNNIGQMSDDIAAAVNYEGKFGPASVEGAFSYERGQLEQNDAAGTFDDRQAWQAGIDVGWAGFHIGGGYFNDDNGFASDGTQKSYGVGLTYAIGPMTVGGSYLNSRRERGALSDEKLDRYMIGARYALGPGIDLRTSVQYYDYDGADPATASSDATHSLFFVFGTILSF